MAVMKKNSTTKTKTSSPSSTSHPPYFQMISEAITTMKERTGSSQPAIAKFIEENYSKQLPSNFRKTLIIQLKRLVKSEKLVKVKNSYKISSTEKANKKYLEAEKLVKVKNSYKFYSVEKVKGTSNQVKKNPSKKGTAKSTAGKKGTEKMKKKKDASPVKRRAGSRSTPAKKAKK